MKKFKSNFVLLSALIGITGTCIGTGIYAYTSANADKLELLNRAVANDTVNELKTTRSDMQIYAGYSHFGAIINNQLYMWGANGSGQLGLGDNTNRNLPTHVSFFDNLGPITQLVLSASNTGVVVNNQLYMWGSNIQYQLGIGNTSAKNTPQRVTINIPTGTITQLALGNEFSGAVIDNKLYMWGSNWDGQLGISLSYPYDKNKNRYYPTHVTDLPEGAITLLALGTKHAGVVIDNKKLYMWGSNDLGQLGTNSTHYYPQLVTELPDGTITQFALGNYHSGVVIDNKKLYMWGSNYYGQLGINKWEVYDRKQLPTLAYIPEDSTITQLSLGRIHSSAVVNNQLYIWGDNQYGQLGLGVPEDHTSYKIMPTHVTSTPPGPITQLVMGGIFSSAVVNNQLYIWGDNQYGQLGINNTTQQNSPVPVNSINTYDSSTPIKLDVNNDKDNLKDKMASEITNDDLTSLIQQSSDKFAINLPLDTTYTISNIKSIPSVNIDGIDKGQVTFDLRSTHSYDQGVKAAIPIDFSNVTIWGFKTPPAPPIDPEEPEKPVEPPVEPDKPVEPIPPVEQPDQPFESPKNDNTWLIVGLSLGGVGLIGIIGTIVLIRRRHK